MSVDISWLKIYAQNPPQNRRRRSAMRVWSVSFPTSVRPGRVWTAARTNWRDGRWYFRYDIYGRWDSKNPLINWRGWPFNPGELLGVSFHEAELAEHLRFCTAQEARQAVKTKTVIFRFLLGIFVGQLNWVFNISRFSWRNIVGKILGETLNLRHINFVETFLKPVSQTLWTVRGRWRWYDDESIIDAYDWCSVFITDFGAFSSTN